MMRKRWTALTAVLVKLPRRTRRLLIGFLCLLLTAPLHGFAERELLPEHLTVRVLHPQAPEPTPSAEPAPTAEPKPTPTPAPHPTPPEEGNYSFLGHKTWKTPVDMADYYLGEMREAAVCGDIQAGHAAESARNDAIRAGGEGAAVSFDDLLLLSRVIDAMAGSDWLTEDFRLCVGEVVLNRVASPEFPNTLQEVVYQRGQYTVVNTARFSTIRPRQECVDCALRLLLGERHMVPAVVYQADYLQGELFTMFPDRQLGSTYFCLSDHLELYS
jgi:hypothetical protein